MSHTLHLLFLLTIISLSSAYVDFYGEMSRLASLSDVPTDSNFTVNTFIGDWNVVGTYGIAKISPHSCPVLDVKKTVTTSLVLTLTSVDVSSSTYNVVSKTYQPNPLNAAILVDILTLKNRQNVAVSYYNNNPDLALLISMDASFALALAKTDNIYANMFLEDVNNIFIEAGLTLNKTVFTNHFGCSTNYTVASNFNAKSFPGKYYGNAVFTTSAALANPTCYNVAINKGETNNVYNLTQYLQYNDSTTNFSTTYIPSPSSAAFLLNVDDTQIPSLVVNYYDSDNDLFILLATDGSYAYVISSQTSLKDSTVTYVQSLLTKQGLNVSDSTFFVSQKACQINNGFEDILS